MRRRLYHSLTLQCTLWVSMLSAVGCSYPQDRPVDKPERVEENKSAIYLGDENGPGRTTDDALMGPSAAVGEFLDIRRCSGTVIARNVVLTARHCFCDDPETAARFKLPQTFTDANGNLQSGFITSVIGAIRHPEPEFDTCEIIASNSKILRDEVIPDLELVILADPIPVEALPVLPQVDLGPNVRQLAETFENYVYVQVGFGGTKFNDGTVGGGTRREGYVGTDTLFYEDGSDGLNGISGWYLDACADSDYCAEIFGEKQSTMSPGDSGGGLFLQPLNGSNNPVGPPILIGVISVVFDYGAVVTQTWASTGNRLMFGGPNVLGTTNASLIAQALGPDLDGDGIFDNADNCAPSTCKANCANPDQLDSDGDFRGDACDSCPQIPDDGSDKDQDGIGDACDPCPFLTNGDETDLDSDGVGAGCDTCPGIANARPSCMSDADCPLAVNFCIKALGASTGTCALQGDDEDRDGFGAACDVCPRNKLNATLGLNANSNPDAEVMNLQSTQHDICEEVPVFIARPIVRPFEDLFQSCVVSGDTETCADSVQFFASGSIGSETGIPVQFPPASVSAPVGFRHCSCFRTSDGLELGRDECMATLCRPQGGSYVNHLSRYRRITITTNSAAFPIAGDVFPVNFMEPTFPKRLFDNSVSFLDMFPHPYDELPREDEHELARLGPTETITWRWRKDVTTGNAQGFPIGAPASAQKTVGIFETIVRPTEQNGTLVVASPRDGDTPFPQELRRTHTYLTTPLAKEAPFADLVAEIGGPCGFMPCTIILQPELPRINPDPTDDPFLTYRTPIDVYTQSGAIYGTTQNWTFDPSPMLSPAVATLLLEGTTQWLRPVERGVTLQALETTTHFVALPNTWTPTSQIREVTYDDGVYELQTITPLAPPVAPNLPPAARNGARGLLSLTRRSVFLVGGKVPGGHTTGEVWRYDLDTQQWSEDIFDAPRLEDVLALTYDSESDRMLVLQRMHPPNLPSHVYRAQLISLDYRTHRAELIDEWPVANTFSRISLTARQDGSFVFLGSAANGQHVKAYRFELNGGKTLKWTGTATIPGELLDEPAVTNAGLVAPLKQGGQRKMKLLYGTDFVPPNKGWVKL